MKTWIPEQMQCSDKYPIHGKLQHKIIKREAHEDANMTNVESDANKETSKISQHNGCGTGQKPSL